MRSSTYGKEFYKQKFIAATMKDAYLKACKWYATNVLSKNELHDIQVEFEKNQNEQFPSVTIHLFAVLDEEELQEKHCEICREFHHLFFINTQFNCNRCDTKAYQKRAEETLQTKISYYKEKLK